MKDERSRVEAETRGPDHELQRCRRDLEAATGELDAFLNAISHDLGAPLRSIQGFSRILLEKHADNLDEKGKDYLGRVQAGARKINQMVGDLLQLSRLSRAGMDFDAVDLSGIVRSIADRLARSFPRRDVTFIVAENINAYGDQSLLTLVLKSLLDNAWKFTGKREGAVIEFGVRELGGERVYFVRDNGAGFEMSQVDRLFKPFQKLHDEIDSPGSGIGLATVHRIIRRSGGKTWAEGETGKGATISFTLGQ